MKLKGQVNFANLIMLAIFMLTIFVVGLLAGIIYYDMNTMTNVLKTVQFTIPIQDNTTASSLNITTFQDILGITVYPILGLKDSLPYLTYFMIFAFIIAMGISAYLSSKYPIFFVVHLLFTFLMTYFALILANTYQQLLSQPFINQMMLPFVIYNKLMLYLPQVVFFTSLLFGVISFINVIKPQKASTSPILNYGGDY